MNFMNKTKKITEGAMLLAIVGAMIILDRISGFMFDVIVSLIAPLVVIMYGCKHGLKYSLFLSAGLCIIAFLLGNFHIYYLIYLPVGIVTGIVYVLCLTKNVNKATLLFFTIITYTIGELIATYIIYPLLGVPVAQMIESLKQSFDAMPAYKSLFDVYEKNLNISMMDLLVVIYLISTILLGIMEGFLIHILAVFVLKKFKIKDLGRMNLWDMKPNKLLAYLAGLSWFLVFALNKLDNQFINNAIL